MMKGMLSKGWVLLMLGVITVGLMGVGYSVWSQQMQVEGVVLTDDMDLNFDKECTNDDGSLNCVGPPGTDFKDDGDDPPCLLLGGSSCDPSGPGNIVGTDPRYDKHIATCTSQIDQVSTGGKIQIHIIHGYPSYWCTMWFDMDNDGSVPVKLVDVLINGVSTRPSVNNIFDADQDGDDDLLVHVSELVLCEQFDPGDTVQGNVDTHIEQGADEEETISYELELIYNIWNEDHPNCDGG